MRIRQIKPDFWRDSKIAPLPMDVKAVFIGLWNCADDSGYLRWDPVQIKFDILPAMDQRAASALLAKSSRLLTRAGALQRLACGHAIVVHLKKHQHLAGETKQVHTIRQEHVSGLCPARPRRSPRVPADPRADPRGQVRLVKESKGQGSDNSLEDSNAALAREEVSEFRRRVPPPPGYIEKSH